MSKQFWHTKTLFIQNWKYKWSYKYNYCIECWTCNFKHKWNWLCTSCREKKRDKTKARQETKKKAMLKYYKLNYKPVEIRKKKESNFDTKKYQKQWQIENKEVLKLFARIYKMQKKWLNCIQIIVNGKIRYLPFTEMLEKPVTTNFDNYEKRKKQQIEFEVLRKYYFKIKTWNNIL